MLSKNNSPTYSFYGHQTIFEHLMFFQHSKSVNKAIKKVSKKRFLENQVVLFLR